MPEMSLPAFLLPESELPLLLRLPAHSFRGGKPVNLLGSGNRRTETQFTPVAQQPVQHLLVLGLTSKDDFAYPAAVLILPLIQSDPKGGSKYSVRFA